MLLCLNAPLPHTCITQGADNVIMDRACSYTRSDRDTIKSHLRVFSKDGLRTLVLARRELSKASKQEAEKTISQPKTLTPCQSIPPAVIYATASGGGSIATKPVSRWLVQPQPCRHVKRRETLGRGKVSVNQNRPSYWVRPPVSKVCVLCLLELLGGGVLYCRTFVL